MGKPSAIQTGWSVKIAAVFGIPIRIHFTFILILIYFGFWSASQGANVFLSILFLLLLFACVVFHELGHALMARMFGVRTLDIVLYPIGGIARLRNIPSGIAELLIASAGPAVNLAIAILLVPLLALLGLDSPLQPFLIRTPSDLVSNLFSANVFLFLFNLIPAFPMDGGRILRSALTFWMPEDRATYVAASIGQGFAVLFGLVGLLWWNPILLLIALFVFLGAGHEAAFVRRRAMVRGRTAREAMITRFETLAPQDSMGHAAQRLLDTHQQDFPVLDAWGRAVGVLSRANLLQGLAQRDTSTAVLDIMNRELSTVPPDARMELVLQQLQAHPDKPVLVVDDSGLIGMITLDNLVEFIEIVRRVPLASEQDRLSRPPDPPPGTIDGQADRE